MSGKVFDLTGSYQAAFLNGIAWNAVTWRSLVLWRGAGPGKLGRCRVT